MKSSTTADFWQAYRRLNADLRKRARQSYRLFAEDPLHPSLHFKKVHAREPIYSVRINLDYRAVGIRDGSEIIWFWIGPHDEYERLLSQS